LDEKPKRVPLAALKRVRNILANPQVALVLDQYDEEWRRLWYVLVQGTAGILTGGEGHERAIELLREKYPPYREMDIGESPVIRITPRRMLPWRAIPQTEGRR
jgi:PPOX class probable F420-dependent enzyme